ncbi:MAG: tRNA adenosine(34) deaminase TadA [Gammaproteobacteria bacterium]|nr:tRNA adenosine(34) deaminase TadA [Gammaproteobacteria bacterium]
MAGSVASEDWPESDVDHMRAALAQAEQAAGEGEIPVGAVVVVGDEIIGSGRNCSVSRSDPAGHAELVALRAAAASIGNHRIPEATLYVTLEPCVMCAGAIAQARVRRVVFGAYDPKAGALGSVVDLSDSQALNHRFDTNGGLLADECAGLLQRFFSARR